MPTCTQSEGSLNAFLYVDNGQGLAGRQTEKLLDLGPL